MTSEEGAGEHTIDNDPHAEYLRRRGALQRHLAGTLNQHWGSLFREGRAPSRLGAQTQDFACVYTSRVSNLLAYKTDKFFARPAVPLPHERGVVAG